MTNKKEPMSVNLSKLVLAVSIIVSLGALFGAVGYLVSQQGIIMTTNPLVEKEITIMTDKTEYEQGEIVKITVRNSLNEAVCFESCNTYYFQKKNWTWEEYLAKKCEVDFIKECIDFSKNKEFEIEFFKTDFEKGTYRIAVPIYTACQNKEFPCEKKEIIYSDEFTIK